MRTDSDQLSMLDKGLKVISLLAEVRTPLRIASISDELGFPRTTVYRLVESLERQGFLRRVGSGKEFFLSLQFLQLGEIVRESFELRQIAYPPMEKLRDEVGMAVHLVIRDGQEAVYVEKIESTRPVRLFTQVGRRAPLYIPASSRIFLAACSDDEIDEYVSTVEMVRHTKNTVADADALRAAVREIRQKGYSVSFSEIVPETAEAAVGVMNHRGEVIAALSLAGPEMYFRSDEIDCLLSRLRHYAGEISKELGYCASC